MAVQHSVKYIQKTFLKQKKKTTPCLKINGITRISLDKCLTSCSHTGHAAQKETGIMLNF